MMLLGEDAPISDLVDLIVAAQIAVKIEKDTDDVVHDGEVKNEVLHYLFKLHISVHLW